MINTKIDKHQLGSSPGSSTQQCVIDLVHVLLTSGNATDKISHYVRVLLMDSSTAFDHIDNTKLLRICQPLKCQCAYKDAY